MRVILMLLGAASALVATLTATETQASEIYGGESRSRDLAVCLAKLDIVKLIDESGSITQPVYVNEVIPAERAFVKAFTISPTATRLSIITFSNTHSVKVAMGSAASKDETKLLKAITQMGAQYVGGTTDPTSALNYIESTALQNKRPDSIMVLVIETDGSFNNPALAISIVNRLKNAGVIRVCMEVGSYVDRQTMQQICDPKYIFSIANYANLIKEIEEKIAETICNIPATASPVTAPTLKPTKQPTRMPTTMAPTTSRPTTATPTTLYPTASPTNATEPADFCDENWIQYLICNPYWLLIPVFRRRITLELRNAQGNPPKAEVVKPVQPKSVGAAKGDSIPTFLSTGSLGTMSGVTYTVVKGDNEVTDRNTARQKQEENIARIKKLKETHTGAYFSSYATGTQAHVNMDRLEQGVAKTTDKDAIAQHEISKVTPGQFQPLDLDKLCCCFEKICCCPTLIAKLKEKIGTPGLGFLSLKWIFVANNLDLEARTQRVTDETVELWVTSFWAWEVPLFVLGKVCHVRVPWERGDNLYIVAASELKAFLTRKWQERNVKDNTTPLSSRAATATVKSTHEQSDKNWYSCCLEMWKQREKQNAAVQKPAATVTVPSKPVTAFSSSVTTRDTAKSVTADTKPVVAASKTVVAATKPVVAASTKPDALSKSMLEPANKKSRANTALAPNSGRQIDMPTGGLSVKERAKMFGGSAA